MNRPYKVRCEPGCHHNNAVYMIRHNDKCIQLHVGKMIWDVQQTCFSDPSRIIQPRLPSHDPAKQTRPVLGADGHEIGPRLGIKARFQEIIG